MLPIKSCSQRCTLPPRKERPISIRKTLIIAVLAALALNSTVHAAVLLFTPPLRPEGSTVLFCNILNVSTNNLSVVAQLMDPSGGIHEGVGAVLTPGQTIGRASSANIPVYCRFTGQTNNKNLVRVLGLHVHQ
jgi:hypothetical protein